MSSPPSSPPISLIEPRSRSCLSINEIWNFRELFYFLVWRDIKIHYNQTALGVVWVVLQPLLTMSLFTLFFGRVAHFTVTDVPYSLMVLCALLPWLFFANSFSLSTNSLLMDTPLIKKVYFPKALIPLAKVCGSLVDLLIGMLFLTLWSCYQGFYPSTTWLLFPALMLYLFAITASVGLFFSALNIIYRDVKHLANFLIQFWLFASPVVYSLDLIPTNGRYLYALNPLVSVIESFRWIVVGHTAMTAQLFAISLFSALALFIISTSYFASVEGQFGDLA